MNQIEKVARMGMNERLMLAFNSESVVEKNLAIRAAFDFIAAMLVDDGWTETAIAVMPVPAEPVATRWQLGDKVRKKRGSSWRGTVCGFYSTPHTPQGYCVDSAFEPGSVQVWPEAALEDWDGVMVEDELRAEITRLTEALRDAEEREAVLRAGLDRIAHRDPWTDPDSPERIARDTLAGAKLRK